MVYSCSEFVQKVRKYKPSELIPAIARLSASRPLVQTFNEEWRLRPPWALAAMARESVLYGNEHRSSPMTSGALDELFNSFAQLADPRDEPTFNAMLTPLAHEQFPHQESIYEEVARASHLWAPGTGVEPFRWEDVIEVSLDAAIRACLMIASLATAQGGRFVGFVRMDWMSCLNASSQRRT